MNQILIGDCREQMERLPERSIHCCVTSPPYWGLRDYGIPPVDWADGSKCVLGLEETPDQFVDHMVEVFQSVRRVLRDDGVLFVNLGDSYASGKGTCKNPGGRTGPNGCLHSPHKDAGVLVLDRGNKSDLKLWGIKTGELLNMPHRVAAALSNDGWFWRSTIIWQKRSPMPESLSGWRWVRCRIKVNGTGWTKETHPGTSHSNGKSQKGETGKIFGTHGGEVPNIHKAKFVDCQGCEKCNQNDGYILRRGKWRPTTAHEYIFMLSKSERYFCDSDAVAEFCSPNTNSKGTIRHHKNGSMQPNASFQDSIAAVEKRNPRSVLTLSSEPYKAAHFATFPSRLPKFCIEASTSSAGCCPSCGSCYAPIVESKRVPTRPGIDNKIWKHMEADDITQRSSTSPNLDPFRHIAVTEVIGHRPTCQCNAGNPVPCVVLDPFGGSGTTAQVAKWLGRDWVVTEINPEYAALAKERIEAKPKWACESKPKKQKKIKPEKLLF